MAKPWWKSFTFWGLITTVVGLLVAGVGEGKPILDVFGDPVIQDTLGQILLTLGIGGAAYGRVRANSPVTLRGRPKKIAPPTEKRNPRVRKPKP